MNTFKPTMYRRDIFDINYQKLKEMGITCIVFDLDNTLGLIDQKTSSIRTRNLIKKLKKDFLILINSNNTTKRLQPYLDELDVLGYALGFKPSVKNLRKIQKKNSLEKSEMVAIGDQMVTDILSGNRFKIMTILVDPLGEKDLKITKLSRIVENKIVKNYQKRGLFERGKYYE